MSDKKPDLHRSVKPAPQEPEVGAIGATPAESTAPARQVEWQMLSTRVTKQAREALDYAAYTTGKKKQEIVSEALTRYRESL